jgi:hypothetical protein
MVRSHHIIMRSWADSTVRKSCAGQLAASMDGYFASQAQAAGQSTMFATMYDKEHLGLITSSQYSAGQFATSAGLKSISSGSGCGASAGVFGSDEASCTSISPPIQHTYLSEGSAHHPVPVEMPDGFAALELCDPHASQQHGGDVGPDAAQDFHIWAPPGVNQSYAGSSQLAATLQSLGIQIADGEQTLMDVMPADMCSPPFFTHTSFRTSPASE